MSRSGYSLISFLTDNIKISITISNRVMDQSSRRRISHSLVKIISMIEFSINSFIDAEEDQFRIGTKLCHSLFDCSDFSALNSSSLGIRDTISEHDYLMRVNLIDGFEFFQTSDNG